MGTFQHRIEIVAADESRVQAVEALVDTGASYTLLPSSFLLALGIRPAFRFPFILADGRRIERDVAEARVRIDGQQRTTLVVFGDEGILPLLGAYTLEGFGFAADPVNKRLVPTPGLLMAVASGRKTGQHRRNDEPGAG